MRMKAGMTVLVAWTVLLTASTLLSNVQKQKTSRLDTLTMARPDMRTFSQTVEGQVLLSSLRGSQAAAVAPVVSAFERFKIAEGEGKWLMLVDRMTARPALMEGKGVPWIPGSANALSSEAMGLQAGIEGKDIPVDFVAGKALEFIRTYPGLFGVDERDLVLNTVGSGPMLSDLYYIDYLWTYHGIPVDGAHLSFRLNHGNLVQLGAEGISDTILKLDPTPYVSLDAAWGIVDTYIGGLDPKAEIVEPGKLLIAPFSTEEALAGAAVAPGKGLAYHLVHELAFRVPGDGSTWTARVDAHTGEILSYIDWNTYGHARGGVVSLYADRRDSLRPFGHIDVGSTEYPYADATGRFQGDTAASMLAGKYVRLHDQCGTIVVSTSEGLLDFGADETSNCGEGGDGNTRAARTMYYHLTQIKAKSLTYFPSNAWLLDQLHAYTNRTSIKCPNAWWDGTAAYFCRSDEGIRNLGESSGIGYHEWAHGLDDNDGIPPPEYGTGESYADLAALFQLRDPCTTRGVRPDPCAGYGNACTDCTGSRDLDYTRHADPKPAIAEDMGSDACAGCTPWECDLDPQYPGPCGYEGHCESAIASQAVYDLVTRKLTAEPYALSASTAWQLAERLFYASRPISGRAFECPGLSSTNGCSAGNWFSAFRVADDADGDLSNGTPHAGALFSAFDDHKIACASVNNTDQPTGCPPLATPSLTASPGDRRIDLSWSSAGTGATQYVVYRNEAGCGRGFTRVATLTAPAQSFSDTAVAPGLLYHYQVQAIGGSETCASAVSPCVEAGAGCTPLQQPVLSTVTASGDHLHLEWTSGGAGATRYFIYRNAIDCDLGPLVATVDAATLSYDDYAATRGVQHYYKVQAATSDPACASVPSDCQSNALPCLSVSTPTLTGDGSYGVVMMDWTSGGAGATAYEIKRGLRTCTAPFDTIAIVPAPSLAYADSDNQLTFSYCYQVHALGGSTDCASPPSNCTCVTPICSLVDFTLTAVPGNNQASLSWTSAGPGVLYYWIGKGSGTGWSMVATVDGSTLNFVDTSITNGQTKQYRVTARTAADACQLNSNVAEVTPQCVQPGTPSLSVTPSLGGARLVWTSGGSSATAYRIFRSSGDCASGFALIATEPAPSLSFADGGLTAGITYYYKITAISQDDSCASGESNCASVTVETCRSDLQFSRPVCSCASTGSITLVDPDYNAAGGVDVFVHSTTYPAEVMIHLARITSTSPYRYRGTFATTPGTPGAGEVQAAHGDQLTARYYDADGCGMPRQVYADAAVECQAPAIAGVEVLNITATGAEVHWFTSEPADSKVTYGAAVPPGTSQSDASPVIEHSIALSALQPCTVYFLSVTSKDAAGNSHTDDNSGAYYSFTTLSEDQTSYARTESPSLPVTDNEPDGVASTLAVPVRRSILDVDVTVTLTHPYVGDLELHLRGPDGTRVPLVRRCGGGGNDFTATVFDDEASTGICAGTAPFTGFFIPDTSLAAFDGKEAYGTWTLEAADWKARDEGAILSWALAFTFPPGCTPNLDVQSAAFTDACYETGSGGGDGVLDPGEDAVLTLTLANTGNQAATAATTAMLDSGTAGVFVFDRSGSFPPLAAGASGTNAGNTFAVRVDDSVACGAPASFTLSSSSPPANQTFTVPVGQTATPAITVLNQPFATAGLPSGWAVEKISGNNWAVDGTGSCSASFALNHPSHTTTDADVWVFTSPIRLFPGRTYTLQFTQRVEADNLPQDLSVWAGLAQDHAAMTLPVWSRTGVTNMDCRTRTASFTVPASDYYHIGFHCTTPAARGLLTVDDILLTFPGNPVCTMNPCSAPPAPGEVAPGTSFAAALIWTDPQTLAWPAEALSTVYRVYRGAPEDLPKTLAGVETNTCIGYEGPATFATAAGTPPPGGFHWYVVTGRNANGEGPAGHDRVVSSWGACP